MDSAAYEVNYLAQAHWHRFHYCFGEMVALDRTEKEVRLGATFARAMVLISFILRLSVRFCTDRVVTPSLA
jgi:hypothetical protein